MQKIFKYQPMRMIAFILGILSIQSCRISTDADLQLDPEKPYLVVCTTGIIGDIVQNVAGNRATVISLMGPGIDPHYYKATNSDLEALNKADIIFYNGLSLEGKMGEIFEKLAREKTVIAISKDIDKSLLLNPAGYSETYDPHIWHDPNLWSIATKTVATSLSKKDSVHAGLYKQNSATYVKKLEALSVWAQKAINEIPEPQRYLITSHDAFSYFGKAFNLPVKALQGISTASEFGLKDRIELVDFIITRKIKSIFIESSVNPKYLEAVVEGCKAKGQQISIGGTLYSDALGDAKGEAGTYIGMVKANVNTIVKGLK